MIRLRAATPADVPAILPRTRALNAHEGIVVSDAELEPALRTLLAQPNLGGVWLICDGDEQQPIGYAVVTFGYDLEFAGRDAWLTELWVDEHARGNGAARAALAQLEDALRERAVRALHLQVRPDNPAVRLYERAGFERSPRWSCHGGFEIGYTQRMAKRGWSANIEDETTNNATFRTVLFTGKLMQLTVMSIGVGEEIGLEIHDDTDQFLRVESGTAKVVMGTSKDALDEIHELRDDWAVIVPAGTWHNVINTGQTPLKLYSIYTPPEHPAGTVHKTKAEADAAEAAHHGH